MEKNMSEVSLSVCQGVIAALRSRNSSRNRSRYQDGGEWRGNPSIPCHLVNSFLPIEDILENNWGDRNVVEEYPLSVFWRGIGNLFARRRVMTRGW